MSAKANVERWRGLMDETVEEVFATMLGLECVPAEAGDLSAERTAARIVFSGELAGECVVIFTGADAARLAEIFLSGAADDAMVADAVGELCNMLAGGWKRRLRPPASGADLSVPFVTQEMLDSSDVRQVYAFDGTQFVVSLTVDAVLED